MAPNSVIFFCVAVLICNVTALIDKLPYGHPCNSNSECRHQLDTYMSGLSFLSDQESVCKNSRCSCMEHLQIRIFVKGNYACSKAFAFRSTIGKCQPSDSSSCINGSCRRETLDYHCFCSRGLVLVGNTCRRAKQARFSDDCSYPDSGLVPVCNYKRNMHCDKSMKCACFTNLFYDSEGNTCLTAKAYSEVYPNETLVGLNEFCGSKENLPKVCDENENMSCENSTCKCKREFYPVEGNGTCESKQSFAEANNLTSYKVMPGDYCYNDGDCITGLDCFKNVCACPYPCTYDNKTITCDCGEVSAVEGAAPAILVGVLGGFVIIIFWFRMIKKTIDKKNKKSEFSSFHEDGTSDPPTYTAPSYGLQHEISTTNPTPYSGNPVQDYPLNPITINATNTPQPSSNLNPNYSTPIPSHLNPSPLNPYPLNPSPLNPSHSTVPDFSSYPEVNSSTIPASSPTLTTNDSIQPPPYPEVNSSTIPPYPEVNSSTIPASAPTLTTNDSIQPPPYTPPPAYIDIYKPIIS